MRRDSDLQKIVDKAERERARAERASRRRQHDDNGPDPEPELDPKRFSVYWRMHDGGSVALWLLALLVIPLIVIAIDHTKIWQGVLVAAVLIAVRLIVLLIGALRGHAKYKQFPGNLQVALEGWSRMLDDRSMLRDTRTWQHTAILEVALSPDADMRLVEAALELSLRSMNACFYGSSFEGCSGDPREKWSRDGLRVSGSANVCVLGALYRLILKLDWIHRRSGGIARIRISKSGVRHHLVPDVAGGE